MDYFLNKIQNNQKKMHFLLYCYTFFILGAMLNGLGPLIPYMSQQYNVSQIQYSMLFPGRTLGYLIGIFVSKFVFSKFTYHKLMIFSSFGFSITCILFNNSTTLSWQAFYICINAITLAFYDIILNCSMLIFNKDIDKAFWVQTGHGAFGIGSLFTPIVTYFFGLSTFLAFSIFNIIMVFGYCILPSPQKKQELQKNSIQKINQNQLVNIQYSQPAQGTQISIQNSLLKNKQPKLKPISFKILAYLTILYFVYAGLETSYSVWIPSYAVITKISSKEEATTYIMAFYLTMTISRFFQATLTIGKNQKTIQIFLKLIMLISVIGVFFHFTYPHLGCYLVSVLLGFAMAPLYSWYLAISHKYGFQLSDSNYSSILMISTFGPTFFPTIIGYSFQISMSFIFVGVFVMTLIQYFFLQKLQDQFEKQLLISQ